ncbi:hypothetical protein OBBRIDRAFT_631020 [Obba rivulosa]|uniref:Uncharacterized protein n=1 Tax=Obba rivulosa TaxID=1052685 RepID=A0A8E2AXN8_9APHY|nr:hypothetical protein OBBRIDRAFT_631020 [Obba rivulosa]
MQSLSNFQKSSPLDDTLPLLCKSHIDDIFADALRELAAASPKGDDQTSDENELIYDWPTTAELPDGWTKHDHFLGYTYYFNEDLDVVVDAEDPQALMAIMSMVDSFLDLLQQEGLLDQLPDDCQTMVQASDKFALCFVSHSTGTVYQLNSDKEIKLKVDTKVYIELLMQYPMHLTHLPSERLLSLFWQRAESNSKSLVSLLFMKAEEEPVLDIAILRVYNEIQRVHKTLTSMYYHSVLPHSRSDLLLISRGGRGGCYRFPCLTVLHDGSDLRYTPNTPPIPPAALARRLCSGSKM